MAKDVFVSPVGRVVEGDLFVPQTKDKDGFPLKTRAGNDKINYFFGLAIPKTDPLWPDCWAKISAVAQAGFPNGEYTKPEFSWKVVDGDLPNLAGIIKEGFAGHWIIKCSTILPYQVRREGFTIPCVEGEVKRGDYVEVVLEVSDNAGKSPKPGVFISQKSVNVVGYGEAINAGMDYSEMYAGRTTQLPAGASATPVAQIGQQAPVAPAPPAMAQQAPVAPVAPAPPAMAQQAPVAPVAPAMAQQAPVAPVAPVAPAMAQQAPVAPVAPAPPAMAQQAPVAPAPPAMAQQAPAMVQQAPAAPAMVQQAPAPPHMQ